MLASGLLHLTRRQLLGSSIPLFISKTFTGDQRRVRHEYTVSVQIHVCHISHMKRVQVLPSSLEI